MRRILIFAFVSIFFCACQHDIARDIYFNVSLDKSNRFTEDQPVKFIFSGEVENIVFYSGETEGEGTVIKNIQNYLPTYEYTWTEPGTYKVSFVGTNCNYLDYGKQVHEMTITILEDISR